MSTTSPIQLCPRPATVVDDLTSRATCRGSCSLAEDYVMCFLIGVYKYCTREFPLVANDATRALKLGMLTDIRINPDNKLSV